MRLKKRNGKIMFDNLLQRPGFDYQKSFITKVDATEFDSTHDWSNRTKDTSYKQFACKGDPDLRQNRRVNKAIMHRADRYNIPYLDVSRIEDDVSGWGIRAYKNTSFEDITFKNNVAYPCDGTLMADATSLCVGGYDSAIDAMTDAVRWATQQAVENNLTYSLITLKDAGMFDLYSSAHQPVLNVFLVPTPEKEVTRCPTYTRNSIESENQFLTDSVNEFDDDDDVDADDTPVR